MTLEDVLVAGTWVLGGYSFAVGAMAILSARKNRLRRKHSGRMFTVTVQSPSDSVESVRMTADEVTAVIERVRAAQAAAAAERTREGSQVPA